MSNVRVLVTGSRDWDDRLLFLRTVLQYVEEYGEMGFDSYGQPVDYLTYDWTIVHGDCPSGADQMADEYAISNWMNVERHPAEWERYGKAAGFRRNAEMVALGADVCLAFIKNESRGASHTARLAEKAGIPTVRITA